MAFDICFAQKGPSEKAKCVVRVSVGLMRVQVLDVSSSVPGQTQNGQFKTASLTRTEPCWRCASVGGSLSRKMGNTNKSTRINPDWKQNSR